MAGKTKLTKAQLIALLENIYDVFCLEGRLHG